MKPLKIILILAIILLFAGAAVFYTFKNRDLKKIKIGEKNIFVEIADTPGERSKGLSGRKNLKENSGMLFVFENSDYHSFWMKDMLIPLDFIWIKNGEIVEITESVKPQDYQPPKILTPENRIDMVLEVTDGFISKNNIEVGEKAILNSIKIDKSR